MVNRRRRVLIAVGVVGVIVVFIAVLPFLLNPVALVNRNLSRIEKIASEKLGRRFTVAHVEGRVFPTLAVTVSGVELSSDTAGEPAMLVMPELELRFRLDKALLSLGNTLELEEITIRDGVLRVRRDVHGGLDVFDVLQKLPPFDPKDIEGGVLSLLSVSNGRVELYDEDSGVELAVHKVKVFVKDAGRCFGTVKFSDDLASQGTWSQFHYDDDNSSFVEDARDYNGSSRLVTPDCGVPHCADVGFDDGSVHTDYCTIVATCDGTTARAIGYTW